MNRERLTYLARKVLPYVDNERFNMGWWVYDPIHLCKTSACAFGHMAISPMGIRDGITLAWSGSPIFQNDFGLDAAAKYFELDDKTSHWLFIDEEYDELDGEGYLVTITPVMVAERIECLLAAGG